MATDPEALAQHRRRLRARTRPLQGEGYEPAHLELERVAEYVRVNERDTEQYGDGDDLQAFEQKVAALLGYPAARFMPSGTMAQPIAMRIWSERAGTSLIGLHPTAHLELHEERGYDHVHGLSAHLVGSADRPMTAADLAAVPKQLGALVVELPTRENGGQLASWSDLEELSELARERDTAIHLDGARLWEAAAGYERKPAEICELFDSTYVSFYKGIGALPGSMLCGPQDFIDEAKTWQRRQGGNLYSLLASWASAEMRLDDQMAKMPAYRTRAIELAAALATLPGVRINPATPQVSMFHVFLEADLEPLLRARDRVAESHDLWLFGEPSTTDVPGILTFEFTVGDATMHVPIDDVTAAFETVLAEGAHAPGP